MVYIVDLYIVGHSIELKTMGIIMLTICNIRGPCCELKYFYWIENSVHFRGFQLMVIHLIFWGETDVKKKTHIKNISYTIQYKLLS